MFDEAKTSPVPTYIAPLFQTRSSHLMELCSLQQRVEELERELRNCQDSFRKLQEQLHNKDLLLQESSDKMTELSRQVKSSLNYALHVSSSGAPELHKHIWNNKESCTWVANQEHKGCQL